MSREQPPGPPAPSRCRRQSSEAQDLPEDIDLSKGVRRQAAEALGGLGRAGDTVVAAPIGLLRPDTDTYVRRQAAEALGGLGRADDTVIAALIGLLATEPSAKIESDLVLRAGNLGDLSSTGFERLRQLTSVSPRDDAATLSVREALFTIAWNALAVVESADTCLDQPPPPMTGG